MSTGYRQPSQVRPGQLQLQTALGRGPAGLVENPLLYGGFLARPEVAAAGLLTVADVAATRYADPGQMKKVYAAMDPVVTAGGDRLRFESFSACNGVYARFDLLPDGLDDGAIAFGTTNIDINQPLRSALAQVGRAELLHLAVGSDAITLATPAESFTERQVELPDRWVRGFAEVPALARRMTQIAELSGPAVARFLGGLPRGRGPGPDLHLSAGRLANQLKTSTDSVLLAGARRLSAAARISRFAHRLTIYRSDVGASGWVFDLPGGRLSLLLSPGAYRGFSGEGSLLTLLAEPDAERIGRNLADAIAWQPSIEPAELARRLGISAGETEAGLAWLAASGRVGFDLTEQRWFHRELPIDADAVLRRSPRLVAARRLVEAGAVSADRRSVRGSTGTIYSITQGECSCAWAEEHHGNRGSCKHLLAVLLSEPGQLRLVGDPGAE